MKDIVYKAIGFHRKGGGSSDSQWVVKFVDGQSFTGPITPVDDGHYQLQSVDRVYYFDADKVVWLYLA